MLAGPTVIQQLSDVFENPEIDAAYGDLLYVDPIQTDRIVPILEIWASWELRFRRGWMPPHPTFYLRRSHYQRLGGYREDFQISADYELIVRMMFKNRLKTAYLGDVLVKMRVGGKSNKSMANRLLANREDRRAWEVNGLTPPVFLQLFKPLES